ncbi:MAG TPA: orotidine-5'-phosphate decarboxylase [Candidatus Hydrothermia bacterium]|nr:orotidine-5'-phosphate decarboxylase [Candidatus Hydrothermia bacterium]
MDYLGENHDFYKVGLPLYLRYGNTVVKELKRRKKRVFLDLKLHDIPSVVAQSITPFERGEVDIITVHISGGMRMLMDAKAEAHLRGIAVAGVSILTSIDRLDLQRLFAFPCELDKVVESMVNIALEVGLDYVVLSGYEVRILNERFKSKIGFIVPGVRFEGEEPGDQSRVITPVEVKELGVNYIVVGRPITHSSDPLAALSRYVKALQA